MAEEFKANPNLVIKKEKEPWEMTFAEFEELFRTKYGDSGFSFAERVGISLGIDSQAGQPLRKVNGKKFGYNESNVRDNWRKAVIKRAIELGKSIPQHVLDDYAKMRVEPVPEPSKPNTSSKDYKAGYNLAIQGRIAPAVPAWTDQGKIDFAQGYKDGQAFVGSLKTYDDFYKEKYSKTDEERFKELKEGFMSYRFNPGSPEAKELVELERKLQGKKEVPVFGLPQDTKKFIEEFGKPVHVPEKPRVIGAPTKQEQALREAREKSHEGKRLKGQVTLFGAVSTSRRLGEFEEKPIIPHQPVKSMADEQSDIEEEREAIEMARATVGRITEQKLRMQIEREKRAE